MKTINNNILSAAISLQMFSALVNEGPVLLKKRTVKGSNIPANSRSVVGFPDTAACLSKELGFEVACRREAVSLNKGDALFVAQLCGGRLPEGTTSLPEGFSFRYDSYLVGTPDGRQVETAVQEMLGNAFSGQMISGDADLLVEKVGAQQVPATAQSVIGHADTAAVAGTLLGRDVPFNRASVSLKPGDVLYVCQLLGGRLPEGSTTLPEGFELAFYKVSVLDPA